MKKKLKVLMMTLVIAVMFTACGGTNISKMTDDELYFWRTREGYEVDFVIENKVAIESKTAKNITNKELKGLRTFMEENAVKEYIIVCRELFERTTDDGIRIMPWKSFLDRLWDGQII